MGFVVQITNRAGRVVSYHKFEKATATVGRGYDCDVILDDPYVDALQLKITSGMDGLQLETLSTEVPTAVEGEELNSSSLPLASGSKLQIGRTHLRVLASDHPVEPVLGLKRADIALTNLGRPVVAIAGTLLFLLLVGLEQYYSSLADEFGFARWAFQAISPLIPAVLWVALAALVTRVVRSDTRVLQHWMVVLICLLGFFIWNYIDQVLRFNLGSHWLNLVLNEAVPGLLLVGLLLFQLRIAFRMKTWSRIATANLLAWGFVGYSVLGTYSWDYDFRSNPEFESDPCR